MHRQHAMIGQCGGGRQEARSPGSGDGHKLLQPVLIFPREAILRPQQCVAAEGKVGHILKRVRCSGEKPPRQAELQVQCAPTGPCTDPFGLVLAHHVRCPRLLLDKLESRLPTSPTAHVLVRHVGNWKREKSYGVPSSSLHAHMGWQPCMASMVWVASMV